MQFSQFSSPSSAFGAYRGNPVGMADAGSSQGSGVQGVGAFAFGMGPLMPQGNAFQAGANTAAGSAWSPTILYLFVLIIAEMFVFGILARHL